MCSTKAFLPPFITSIIHQSKSFLPEMSTETTLWYWVTCIEFHFVHHFSNLTIPIWLKHSKKRPIIERGGPRRNRSMGWCDRTLCNATSIHTQSCKQTCTQSRWQSYLFELEQGHVLTAGPIPSNSLFHPLFLCFSKKYPMLLAKMLLRWRDVSLA